MSLPPEHITIKRRRDDEPVDALCMLRLFYMLFSQGVLTYIDIQKEHQHKKRRFTDFVFRRVPENEGHNRGASAQSLLSRGASRETQRATSGYPLPQVPTVRASLPGEEHQRRPPTNSTPYQVLLQTSPEPSSIQRVPGSDDIIPEPSIPAAEPRRFHLTKSASSLSLRHQTPSSGIQRHKRSRRNDLAVFVEKSMDKIRPKSSRGNSAVAGHGQSQMTGDSTPNSTEMQPMEHKPRKRPNISAAEKKWRAETWGEKTPTKTPRVEPARGGRTIHDPSNNWDYNSIELAEQLQLVTLQESANMNGSIAAAGNALSSPNPKIKPKAPPLRYRDRQPRPDVGVDEEMETDNGMEDDTDYVYDTFVRQVGPSNVGSPAPSTDTLQALVYGKIGILVITEEDEAVWETYGEDDESDKDWNSEEEDENGAVSSLKPCRRCTFVADSCS